MGSDSKRLDQAEARHTSVGLHTADASVEVGTRHEAGSVARYQIVILCSSCWKILTLFPGWNRKCESSKLPLAPSSSSFFWANTGWNLRLHKKNLSVTDGRTPKLAEVLLFFGGVQEAN